MSSTNRVTATRRLSLLLQAAGRLLLSSTAHRWLCLRRGCARRSRPLRRLEKGVIGGKTMENNLLVFDLEKGVLIGLSVDQLLEL